MLPRPLLSPLPTSPGRPPARSVLERRNWLFGGVFVGWGACVTCFDPRLLALLPSTPSSLVQLLYLAFVLLLNLFWLFGVYHLAVVGHRVCCSPVARPRTAGNHPASCALLYTTRNDFRETAALSCVRQDHPRTHVYLLDDSTTAEWRARVDRFHAAHPAHTTIVRRPT